MCTVVIMQYTSNSRYNAHAVHISCHRQDHAIRNMPAPTCIEHAVRIDILLDV